MNKCITTAGSATSSSNPNRTLSIVHEFRQLYENKIRIIDNEGSGDCGLLAKVSLQQDWIRDLNEQNEMLVSAVEELEQEATERVMALEEKLKQSSKHTAEVMNGYKDLSIAFQYVDAMQDDITVLLEFIKNSVQHQTWNTNGLKLRTVCIDDIEALVNHSHSKYPPPRKSNVNGMNYTEQVQMELNKRDNDIKALQHQLMGNQEDLAKNCHKCEEIKQSMLDMRGALTAEVADKHDAILQLKRDVFVLEEQCRKADQQTHFKDDIIKELRKEIKGLKAENEELVKAQLQSVELENSELRFAVRSATSELECLEERTAQCLNEKEQLESCCKESLQKVLQLEAEKLNQQQLIFDIQADCAKRIACMEQVFKEEHGTCPCRSAKQPSITKTFSNATCNTEKVSAMDCNVCTIDTAAKECQTICCKISPAPSLDSESDGTAPSSLKAEEGKLEEVVHGLHASVSKMMATESQCKKDKARILELENELSIAWRTKDSEVENARKGREQEIVNLNELIETLNTNLSVEKQRANNLQQAVDIYCESMDTMKGSEEKFKQEVIDQKTTIKNLQDALIQAKQQLEELQHKSQSDLDEQLNICNNLIELLSETDEKMHIYIRQCEDLSVATQKLIDENTRLEEALFFNHQDLEMYEMRLSKYHVLYNSLEVEHAKMLQELQLLQDQYNDKETFIQTLSESLGQCREELSSVFQVLEMQNIDKDDQTDQCIELQSQLSLVSEKLSHTLLWWQKEKTQNQRLAAALRKSQQATKIIKREAKLAHDKLHTVALRMAKDEQKIHMFSKKIKEYQSSVEVLQEEQADLQMRMKEVQDELIAKNQECGNMQESIKTIQEKYIEETSSYKKTITKLTTNVSHLQCECEQRAKDLEHTIAKCVECDLNEQQTKQNLIERETSFSIQLNKFRNEQDRLISVVTNLEEQIRQMNKELAEKDDTLEMLRSTGQDKLREKHEDNVHLKNEINNLLQSQAMLKAENNQLQVQLAQVRKSLIANDEKHKSIIHEMEACMNDLQHDKEMLINKHEQLLEEVQSLQEMCNCKMETITHLEIQLNDMKCVRDALCIESRQVIDHVKCWLQEQRKINMELNHCVKRKNELIAKHKQEKLDLMEKIKTLSGKLCNCRCPCNYAPPSVKREDYAVQVIHSPQGDQSRGVWSMESVDSNPSSLNADSEWEIDYRNMEQYPQTWIHQVQNFTEELQQNNRYWKNKTYTDQEYSPTMVCRDK